MRVACLSLILLFVATLGPAQARDDVWVRHNHELMLQLHKTRHLLGKAKRNYKGHNRRAVKHIQSAIDKLKKETQLKGAKGPGPTAPNKVQPWESNKHLVRARDELRFVHFRLEKNLVHTPHRNDARKQIHQAIAELEKAMKVKQPMKGLGMKKTM